LNDIFQYFSVILESWDAFHYPQHFSLSPDSTRFGTILPRMIGDFSQQFQRVPFRTVFPFPEDTLLLFSPPEIHFLCHPVLSCSSCFRSWIINEGEHKRKSSATPLKAPNHLNL
jgi:hypothetical protein